MWVLATLNRETLHGYEMMQRLNEHPVLGPVNPGGLYRLLRELEAEGLIESSWSLGGGPPRRIYRITPEGKAWLKSQKNRVMAQIELLQEILRAMDRG